MLVQPRKWGGRYGNQIQDVAILVIGDQLSTAVHRPVSGRGGLVVLGAHVPAHCGTAVDGAAFFSIWGYLGRRPREAAKYF